MQAKVNHKVELREYIIKNLIEKGKRYTIQLSLSLSINLSSQFNLVKFIKLPH